MAGESASQMAHRMRARAQRLRAQAEQTSLVAEQWERGADGERATAAVLDSLPSDSWTSVHDVRWPGRPRANIDHVTVGPPGVFVIDSKNWSGTIDLDSKKLRQNGQSRESEIVGAARAGRAIARLLGIESSIIVPVICLLRDDDICGEVGGAIVCTTANLERTLAARPAQIDKVERERISHDLASATQAASQPNVDAESVLKALFFGLGSRSRGPSSSVGAGRRSKRPTIEPAVVVGEWSGTFQNRFGTAVCSMRVDAPDVDGKLVAAFTFESVPGRVATGPGSLLLVGTVRNGLLRFEPNSWVERPAGCRSFGFRALGPTDGGAWTGVVTGTVPGRFQFTRKPLASSSDSSEVEGHQ